MRNIKIQKTKTDRFDPGYIGQHIQNESSKLPGHEQRMKNHIEKVKKEYFNKKRK